MSYFPARILLALDGTENDEAATRAAVDLANRSGAQLIVVHTFEFIPAREYAGVALRLRSPSDFEREARRILEQVVGDIEDMGGVVAEARLRMGSPGVQIPAAAAKDDVGLIVMGRREPEGVERLFSDSVAERVLDRAECPVLTLRAGEDAWPPVRVVVSDDSSEGARKAGELAASIGSLYGAGGSLVRIYPKTPKGTGEELWDSGADHAAKQAEALAQTLGSRLDMEFAVDEGDAARVARSLLEAAWEVDGPSMVSTGQREAGMLRRMRADSVSGQIVRSADGPVLVSPRS